MSNRNIFIITLILGFLPNLIFAATVNSITPDKGKAGEIVEIIGENFGDNKKSVDSGYRYVRVGGFINTKIVSWSDSAIKISAPTLQEVTSDITRLNPFWLAADLVDVASFGLLSFVVELFDTAASPVSSDVDNTVAITVVTPPLQESNQGFFTYTAQSPLMGVAGDFNNLLSITYDTFGENIVGLLTNPKELAQTKIREIIRGLQEVPLFVRDLFTGRNPAQSSTTKKDNCDFSHYQIKYNEPQPTIEAIRDKITSLNVGRYSAVNSDGRTIIQIRGNEKDGPLTKTELDKLNKGLAELGIFQPLVFSSLEAINGVCGRPNEPLIITKEDMEKLWGEDKKKQGNNTPQSNIQINQQPQAQAQQRKPDAISCSLSSEQKQIIINLNPNEWSCLIITPDGSRYQVDPENKNTELTFKFSDGSTFVDGPGNDPEWLGERRGIFQLMSKLPMKVLVIVESPPFLANLMGVWNMTWRTSSWQQGSSEIKMTQNLGEKKFTGEGTQIFEGQTQTFTIEGEVTQADIVGRNVSFTGNFGNDKVTYRGTAIDDRADGTWKHSSGNSGTWSMTRKVNR